MFFATLLTSHSLFRKWTAVTRDGKRSAQFEETLLVTDTGIEILTAAPAKTATKPVENDSGTEGANGKVDELSKQVEQTKI